MGLFKKRKFNRIDICFNCRDETELPYRQSEVVVKLLLHFDLFDTLTSNAQISVAYGNVPGVAEALADRWNAPDEFLLFVICRADAIGMKIKNPAKDIYPFKVKSVRDIALDGTERITPEIFGVLIAGNVENKGGDTVVLSKMWCRVKGKRKILS